MKDNKVQYREIPQKPRYLIYEDGRVINKNTGRVLAQQYDKDGYIVVQIQNKGFKLHRLLAEAFIPNPLGLPQVNHINGRKDDFRVSNLEWCTNKQNCIHAAKLGLGRALPVIRVDNKGNKVIYNSIAEAAKYFDNSISARRNILSCCKHIKGQRKAYGYEWLFVKEVVNP